MTEGATIVALLELMDAEQARLREMLAGKDDAVLAQRPLSGKWSVVENVRHLVLVELAHHSHLVVGGHEWRTMVLPPHNLQMEWRLKMAGTPATTVPEALEAWQPLHATVRTALLEHDTAEERYRLGRHIKHLQQHVNEVQRLLRARARAAKAPGGAT